VRKRAAKVVAITGTPGTGKSTAARIFARRADWKYVDLNGEIVKNRLYSGYDRKRRSYITDMRKVIIFVRSLVHGETPLLIDGHLSHDLPSDMLDKVIVLRCRPDVLRKRLERKRWSKSKVDENVEAEMIGIISWEAKKRHANVVEIDTTGLRPKGVADRIEKVLKGGSRKHTAP
jgi:adenylate kinase